MLFEKLKKNADSGVLPMHMPGHKRNCDMLGADLPYELDITEIEGFDNLHDMSGVLRDMARTAASIYGAAHAFPLVNGTTGGILAAVRACAGIGGSIVMSRFSHKSVYNAAELCGLTPVFIVPEQENGIAQCVTPQDVAGALENTPNARCVVITSPTYEGVVSDIAAISGITRMRNIPLIVDAAHGSHFGFSPCFPKNAVRLGADIELISLHKTLPALTQSSLALIGDGLVSADELRRQLGIFQTSSPSYILLASIDRCLKLLSDDRKLFENYSENLRFFYEKIEGLTHLNVKKTYNTSGYDLGKIVIKTNETNITGKRLQSVLRKEYKIELEMAAPEYALAMTSVCDGRGSFERLADALLKVDAELENEVRTVRMPYMLPERAMTPREAREKRGEPILLRRTLGRVVLEYVWVYPPGIPLLVPGEIVDERAIRHLEKLEETGIVPRSDYGIYPEIMCQKA